MKQFTEELKTTGGLILQGVGEDQEKATQALKQLNELIAKNDGIVEFLLDPNTQEMMTSILKNPAIKKLMF